MNTNNQRKESSKKKSGPLVSVIVPIYNSEKYLKQCLSSIVNQSYENLQIILVNDGSQDNSLLICQEFQKRDIRIKIIDQQNRGVSYSRNVGILESKGFYLIFIDSDDYIDRYMVEKLVNIAQKENSNLVICGYCEFNGQSGVVHKKIIYSHSFSGEIRKDFHLFLPAFVSIAGPVAKLYSKKIIETKRIFFEESISSGEDQVFNFKYYTYIKSYSYIPESLYYYRKENTKSLSSVTTYKSAIDDYLFRKELKNFLITNNVSNKEKIFSDSCTKYFHRHILVSDKENSYFEFKVRAIKINQLLRDLYCYKKIKWILLFFCLKNDIYFIPYCYYRIKKALDKIRSRKSIFN